MKLLRLRLRLTSLLLGLCVLLASVGVPLTERACPMSGAVDISLGAPAAEAPAEECCASHEATAEPPTLPLPFTAKKLDSSDCCAVSVAYLHVVPDAVGPVFDLHLPAFVATLPALPTWRPTAVAVLSAAHLTRLFGADSSPPGRWVGRVLVMALHQLRN